MTALLSVFFAACALLVIAIGLYGTPSYCAARRTQVVSLVLRKHMALEQTSEWSTSIGVILPE